jgi:peptidoglycan hydrolase CwlO-like protein
MNNKISIVLLCSLLLLGCKTPTLPSGAHKTAGEQLIAQAQKERDDAVAQLRAVQQQLDNCRESSAALEVEYGKASKQAAECRAELARMQEQVTSANAAKARAEADKAKAEADAARVAREKAEADAAAARAKAEADAAEAKRRADEMAARQKAQQDSIDNEAAKNDITLRKENFQLINASQDQTTEGYHIVVGSFGVENNANRLHTLLTEQGNQPSIARNESGMFRVIIATEPTYLEASKRVAVVRAAGYPDAWILVHQ